MEPDERLDKLEQRLADTETILSTHIQVAEKRFDPLEWQVARLTSHIESEVGLAREQLGRIETKLFGKEDEEYSGQLGALRRRLYLMEVWFKAIMASTVILGFLFAAYQFVTVFSQ